MLIVLLILAAVVLPLAILLCNDYGSKRGCGRGCATCGNRDICYRTRTKPQQDPPKN